MSGAASSPNDPTSLGEDSTGDGRLTPDEQLKIAIFDQIPFTIWASTRDFRIVLWNRTSEDKYGYSSKEAVGRDYVELFVDELEKDDSKDDCLQIIDRDKKFKNFLAYDHAADGSTRTMLTNCFRVYDRTRNEYLQVEVGVSADELNLDLERDRLHSLRELAKKRNEERAKAKEAVRDSLISSISDKLEIRNLRLEVKRQRIEEQILDIGKDSPQSQRLSAELQKIDNEHLDIRRLKRSLLQRIQAAATIEDLIKIQDEADAQT